MRKYTAYEINRLQKYGIDPFKNDVDVDDAKPVEYSTGFAEFFGREFFVNKNVLIPRVESEELVKLAIEFLKGKSSKSIPIYIADIGTGSGAIGITLALELREKEIPFKIFLSDISEKALDVTKKNVEKLLDAESQNCFTFDASEKNDNQKILIKKSNLLDSYPKSSFAKFDLIIANLPYIPSDRISQLSKPVKDFEPHLALDGGKDGLQFIYDLLEQAKIFLTPNGIVLLEVDDTHTQKIADEIGEKIGFKIAVKNDLNNKNRYWIVTSA